jgi:DNA modification methylase
MSLRDFLFYEEPGITLYCGDALTVLREIPASSVHCVVTSPPYWGLRDYGVAGQLGLEPTPEEYVANMVAIFREVRRVLREDGTLWLNLGDSYCGSPRGNAPGDLSTSSLTNPERQDRIARPRGASSQRNGRSNCDEQLSPNRWRVPGLKPKDLVGIPFRVAFALQANGWWLRSDIIWAKPNPMPESVTDRPTKAHEYLFLLSKSAIYYYDAEAIKEPSLDHHAPGMNSRAYQDRDPAHGPERKQRKPAGWDTGAGAHGTIHRDGRAPVVEYTATDSMRRNRRSVWTIATEPNPEAHFATFPTDLVTPCILAGCPSGGLVLDPFIGSGTAAFVAKELNRRAIGIDLKGEYLDLAVKRLRQEVLDFPARREPPP